MKNQIKKHIVAAYIEYGGIKFVTRLHVEYKHTGEYYFLNTKKGQHILSGEESAILHKAKKKKVFVSSGYYFIDRLAIPMMNAKEQKDIWYINNPGDRYAILKVSKYGRKIHEQLSREQIKQF